MVRQIITINVGGAGIALGSTIWEQYCLEHNIGPDGKQTVKSDDRTFQSFFAETADGKYVPRCICVDTEPESIDNLKVSKYGKMFHPEFLISGKDGADGCFSRGYYKLGRDLIDFVNDRLRKNESFEWNGQGFVINHAVSGGTGSGLGALILERITIDHRKKAKLGIEIYPFNNNHSNNYVETYNALLSTHWLLYHTDVSLIFDNRQLFNICRNKLFITEPNYSHFNSIITKIVSEVTFALRFERSINKDMCGIQSDTVPFPRLHFMTCSMSPMINKSAAIDKNKKLIDGYVRDMYSMQIHLDKISPPLYQDVMEIIYSVYDINVYNKTVAEITQDMFDPSHFSVECVDFDPEEDKYMSVWVLHRGKKVAMEANASYKEISRSAAGPSFVEWCPIATRCKLEANNNAVPPLLECDIEGMVVGKRRGVMIGNNCSISRFFSERISKVYDRMYSQRAFVHWFVRDGMEEIELVEAREDLRFLEKDYLDALSEQVTDDYDDESD